MSKAPHCPALFISAFASGQGKTTVTAALARLHRERGRRVRIFKTGPDYLDPLILERAAGTPVEPLDLWMTGEARCREALHLAAASADLILIEGAMGLFDGSPSSADLAIALGIPVVAVINARGMAQSVAAIAHGLAHYRPELKLAGVVANQLGSERHRALIEQALPPETPLLAALPRDQALALPGRHLGLVPPDEQPDLERIIIAAASALVDGRLAELPAPIAFPAPETLPPAPRMLEGVRIAIARDQAFSFVYPANLRLLEAMGARLSFFSPLVDTAPPEAEALWLPGGYPELHAERLAANTPMAAALRAFHAEDKPILAECGGMLYLLDSLRDLDGRTHRMAGVLPGRGEMRDRSGCQGMQSAALPEGEIRGHAHHRSRSYDMPAPIAHGIRPSHPAPGEAIYRQGRLTASYLHLYFASNPQAIGTLFAPS
ncbi:cobyrinate a,c-diamide synthase [Halotalea alkalilenta]|uniref:Cobyrinic acid a,c-diamide synthase n=1 Tax=Halotalea alkalilenta TaxID=376489 RepID=A0A172YFJ3_9GAMM|nr:cobyrinate a,c-diamide synthase [Halotalea alkalilenta]ANF58040.1 cobyrinic acid a,c-diamide synthase [Halotalea alkalilenta]